MRPLNFALLVPTRFKLVAAILSHQGLFSHLVPLDFFLTYFEKKKKKEQNRERRQGVGKE